MIYYVPIGYAISFGIIIFVAFISGYFFILRHLRKEKEKENTGKEINKIGKIE